MRIAGIMFKSRKKKGKKKGNKKRRAAAVPSLARNTSALSFGGDDGDDDDAPDQRVARRLSRKRPTFGGADDAEDAADADGVEEDAVCVSTSIE